MLVQREVRWVFLARSLNSKAGAVPLKTQWGEGAYGFSPLEIVAGGRSETTNSFPQLHTLSKRLVSAWKVTSEKNLVICLICAPCCHPEQREGSQRKYGGRCSDEMLRRGNAAAPQRDKATVRAKLGNDALNVGFFFGMSLSMSEPNAEEHECSAHNLRQR
jgi:hypothetical protein